MENNMKENVEEQDFYINRRKNFFDMLEKYVNNTITQKEMKRLVLSVVSNNPFLDLYYSPEVVFTKLDKTEDDEIRAEYLYSTHKIVLPKTLISDLMQRIISLTKVFIDLGHELKHFKQYRILFELSTGEKDFDKHDINIARTLYETNASGNYLKLLYKYFKEYFSEEYCSYIDGLSKKEYDEKFDDIAFGLYVDLPYEKDARREEYKFAYNLIKLISMEEGISENLKAWCLAQEKVIYDEMQDENEKKEFFEDSEPFVRELQNIPIEKLLIFADQLDGVDDSYKEEMRGPFLDETTAFKHIFKISEESDKFREEGRSLLELLVKFRPKEEVVNLLIYSIKYSKKVLLNAMINTIILRYDFNKEDVDLVKYQVMKLLKEENITLSVFGENFADLLTADEIKDLIMTYLIDNKITYAQEAVNILYEKTKINDGKMEELINKDKLCFNEKDKNIINLLINKSDDFIEKFFSHDLSIVNLYGCDAISFQDTISNIIDVYENYLDKNQMQHLEKNLEILDNLEDDISFINIQEEHKDEIDEYIISVYGRDEYIREKLFISDIVNIEDNR